MTENFQKHHRRSIRLPRYDYTQPGAYYITICTYQRQCWLGNIINGQMYFNQLGKIVYKFWQVLPNRFPHIQLDAFVVMPNHLHGILIISKKKECTIPTSIYTEEKFGKPVAGSIPTVIRSFKSSVTKQINLMRETPYPPIWQRNYYESVIRSEKHLENVRLYIANNPLNWEKDEENPTHYQHETLDLDVYF
ncbi:MAG TPA: transposase [Nostocaceae cyanobacterium]|nr:transposase [Nostocaceae cyanobacterium]